MSQRRGSVESELRPLTVALPDAHGDGELQGLRDTLVQERADVLHGGVVQELVPVAVVVLREDGAHLLLEVREVEDHPAAVLALDGDVHLVGVPGLSSASLVPGEVVRAVDVLRDAELHAGANAGAAKRSWGRKKRERG